MKSLLQAEEWQGTIATLEGDGGFHPLPENKDAPVKSQAELMAEVGMSKFVPSDDDEDEGLNDWKHGDDEEFGDSAASDQKVAGPMNSLLQVEVEKKDGNLLKQN